MHQLQFQGVSGQGPQRDTCAGESESRPLILPPTLSPATAGLLHHKAASQSTRSFSLWGSSQGLEVTVLNTNPGPGTTVGTSYPVPCLTLFDEDSEGQIFPAKGTQLVSGWTRRYKSVFKP